LQYKQLLEQSCFRKGDPSMQMSALQNRPWWPCNGRLSVGHVLHLCFMYFHVFSCRKMAAFCRMSWFSLSFHSTWFASMPAWAASCHGMDQSIGSQESKKRDAQNAHFKKRLEDPETTENELKHCIKNIICIYI
jgi:hypothetical protein